MPEIPHTDDEKRIAPITNHVAGDSIVFGWYTIDQDMGIREIDDDNFAWYLFERRFHTPDDDEAVLDNDDDNVTIEVDTDADRWRVVVLKETTTGLRGVYSHRSVVEGPDDRRQTWFGEVVVYP